MEPSISGSELFTRLGDDDVLVIDCRSDEDWNRYGLHIPGALGLPLAELAEAVGSLPDDELIVLSGTAPDGSDERRAQRFLGRLGFSTVRLEGGLHGWISGGFPTERHPPRGGYAADSEEARQSA